jgi:hypothetical protein
MIDSQKEKDDWNRKKKTHRIGNRCWNKHNYVCCGRCWSKHKKVVDDEDGHQSNDREIRGHFNGINDLR